MFFETNRNIRSITCTFGILLEYKKLVHIISNVSIRRGNYSNLYLFFDKLKIQESHNPQFCNEQFPLFKWLT